MNRKNMQMNRKTYRWTDKIYRLKYRWAEKNMYSQIDKHTDVQTHIQRNRQIYRWTLKDKHTYELASQKDIHIHILYIELQTNI